VGILGYEPGLADSGEAVDDCDVLVAVPGERSGAMVQGRMDLPQMLYAAGEPGGGVPVRKR